MTVEGRERAVLQCNSCGIESEHIFQYAGRVLVYTECGNCGFAWHHREPDLRTAYVHDLGSRVWSKPGRWVRRLRRHPIGTVIELPIAIAAQPVKLAREIVTVLRG